MAAAIPMETVTRALAHRGLAAEIPPLKGPSMLLSTSWRCAVQLPASTRGSRSCVKSLRPASLIDEPKSQHRSLKRRCRSWRARCWRMETSWPSALKSESARMKSSPKFGSKRHGDEGEVPCLALPPDTHDFEAGDVGSQAHLIAQPEELAPRQIALALEVGGGRRRVVWDSQVPKAIGGSRV